MGESRHDPEALVAASGACLESSAEHLADSYDLLTASNALIEASRELLKHKTSGGRGALSGPDERD